jgi:serine/threonine protein kinase
MPFQPNDTPNNDHYRIIRQLGRGGFGSVYLGSYTALSIIRPPIFQAPSANGPGLA